MVISRTHRNIKGNKEILLTSKKIEDKIKFSCKLNEKQIKDKSLLMNYPKDSKFVAQYLDYAEKCNYFLSEHDLNLLKKTSKNLLSYKRKDIIQDLFQNFSSTLDNLESIIQMEKVTLFTNLHETLCNSAKNKPYSKENIDLLTLTDLTQIKDKTALEKQVVLLNYYKNILLNYEII